MSICFDAFLLTEVFKWIKEEVLIIEVDDSGIIDSYRNCRFNYFFYQKNKKDNASKPGNKRMPYSGVKIDECDFSCPSSFVLSRRVFLTREAPKLPLAGCDRVRKCQCKLIHFDDRRQNPDNRRVLSQVLRDIFRGDEKRISIRRGRRIED